MADALDTAKFFVELVREGKPKVDVDARRVNALPVGRTKGDVPGPWQTATYTEYLREYTMLGRWAEELGVDGRAIDYAISVVWDHNGQYMSDWHVSASGTVQIFTDLSIDVQTYEASYDDRDVVQMRYEIVITRSNVTAGSRRIVISAMARGDGGGMSLGAGEE